MPGSDLFEQLAQRRAKRAARLVGRDDAARLRWLIRFAENGERLSRHDFAKVAAAIEAFAERGGTLARNVGAELTPGAAAQLALMVRDGLRAYAKQVTPEFPPLDFTELQFLLVPGSDRGPWLGPWRALFLIALGEVVWAERDRLRTCAGPACGRLFFKRKRGLYCSSKCSQAERMRRFREDAERYQQRRHEHYVRRLARSKGLSVEAVRKMVKRRSRPRGPT
jgi:hypothetical protein